MTTVDPPENTWLRRVQALLAKAESTEFEAEAETLMAKAQELMARHAIDEAMLAAAGGTADEIVSEVVIVDPPYAGPRASLLGAVASANGCRMVVSGGRGSQRCVLVGHRSDLAKVTTLFAALAMHASRAMLASPVPPYDTPRRFRHAFLLAFAGRIAERLHRATRDVRRDAERSDGPATAIVLASRSDAVDRVFARQFPHTTPRRTQSSSYAGHHTGRDAADRADVGRTGVRGTRGDLSAG